MQVELLAVEDAPETRASRIQTRIKHDVSPQSCVLRHALLPAVALNQCYSQNKSPVALPSPTFPQNVSRLNDALVSGHALSSSHVTVLMETKLSVNPTLFDGSPPTITLNADACRDAIHKCVEIQDL
jgi:hypothetical protein